MGPGLEALELVFTIRGVVIHEVAVDGNVLNTGIGLEDDVVDAVVDLGGDLGAVLASDERGGVIGLNVLSLLVHPVLKHCVIDLGDLDRVDRDIALGVDGDPVLSIYRIDGDDLSESLDGIGIEVGSVEDDGVVPVLAESDLSGQDGGCTDSGFIRLGDVLLGYSDEHFLCLEDSGILGVSLLRDADGSHDLGLSDGDGLAVVDGDDAVDVDDHVIADGQVVLGGHQGGSLSDGQRSHAGVIHCLEGDGSCGDLERGGLELVVVLDELHCLDEEPVLGSVLDFDNQGLDLGGGDRCVPDLDGSGEGGSVEGELGIVEGDGGSREGSVSVYLDGDERGSSEGDVSGSDGSADAHGSFLRLGGDGGGVLDRCDVVVVAGGVDQVEVYSGDLVVGVCDLDLAHELAVDDYGGGVLAGLGGGLVGEADILRGGDLLGGLQDTIDGEGNALVQN